MKSWLNLTTQMMMLGFESQFVIYHRLAKMQVGGAAADREARRMVSEKNIAAASEAFAMGLALASGRRQVDALQSTVKSYRKRVAANRRRLIRPPRKRKA